MRTGKLPPVVRHTPIPFTRDGYEALKKEKETLTLARPEAVENLRKAREMGDLSENGYYKAARARLSFLDGRLRRLARIIRSAVVVEHRISGKIGIGSTVTINDGSRDVTYSIAGTYESDPAKGVISYVSPLGKMLMGRQKGETVRIVTPSGTRAVVIADVQ